jgi:hypothetical protein
MQGNPMVNKTQFGAKKAERLHTHRVLTKANRDEVTPLKIERCGLTLTSCWCQLRSRCDDRLRSLASCID